VTATPTEETVEVAAATTVASEAAAETVETAETKEEKKETTVTPAVAAPLASPFGFAPTAFAPTFLPTTTYVPQVQVPYFGNTYAPAFASSYAVARPVTSYYRYPAAYPTFGYPAGYPAFATPFGVAPQHAPVFASSETVVQAEAAPVVESAPVEQPVVEAGAEASF
jgi:hypothetical protein